MVDAAVLELPVYEIPEEDPNGAPEPLAQVVDQIREDTRPERSSLRWYLTKVGRFRLLKREEAAQLSARVRAGDLSARNALVEHNLRLAVMVARRYLGRGVEYEDLIQEANLGLIRAAERFDGRLGFAFSTYALWWVRQCVTRAIANDGRTVRVPVHEHDFRNTIRRVSQRLVDRLGREPKPEEIAVAMKADLSKVKRSLRGMRLTTVSLDDLVSSDGDDRTIGSTIEDTGGISPEHRALGLGYLEDVREQFQSVMDALRRIPPREREVMELRYGLDGSFTPHPLKEIAERFDVTKQRINQLIGVAWLRLWALGFPAGDLRKELEDALERIRQVREILLPQTIAQSDGAVPQPRRKTMTARTGTKCPTSERKPPVVSPPNEQSLTAAKRLVGQVEAMLQEHATPRNREIFRFYFGLDGTLLPKRAEQAARKFSVAAQTVLSNNNRCWSTLSQHGLNGHTMKDLRVAIETIRLAQGPGGAPMAPPTPRTPDPVAAPSPPRSAAPATNPPPSAPSANGALGSFLEILDQVRTLKERIASLPADEQSVLRKFIADPS